MAERLAVRDEASVRVIDDAISGQLLRAVAATWPRDDWPHWHRYRDETADKFATKDADRLPPAAKLVIAELAKLDLSFIDSEAMPDFDCHGAGLHMVQPGGYLRRHLDGVSHPLLPWTRVASVVLFVDREWRPEWGGELQFFPDAHSESPMASVSPRFNRVVIFSTANDAWHHVTTNASPFPRRTISLFFWVDRKADTERDRAMFTTVASLGS